MKERKLGSRDQDTGIHFILIIDIRVPKKNRDWNTPQLVSISFPFLSLFHSQSLIKLFWLRIRKLLYQKCDTEKVERERMEMNEGRRM